MTSRTSLPCPAGACDELPPTDGSLPVSTPLITMGWMYLGRWSWVRLATSAVFSFPITMAPRIATPATAPTSRLAFVAAAAMPERSGGTTASTDEVIGTTQEPIPMPVTARAAASGRYDGFGLITALVHSRPPAKAAQPPMIDPRMSKMLVHRPASSDAAIIRTVIGRNTSAIWPPLYPLTSSRNSAVKKKIANVAKYAQKATTTGVPNRGTCKNLRSSSGRAARLSHQRKAAKVTALAQSSPSTSGELKPALSALMTAKISVASAAAPSTAPPMSIGRGSGSAFSGRTTAASAIAAIPKITLNQKIARHDHAYTSAPPTTGPRASADPDTAAQTPSARFRLR